MLRAIVAKHISLVWGHGQHHKVSGSSTSAKRIMRTFVLAIASVALIAVVCANDWAGCPEGTEFDGRSL